LLAGSKHLVLDAVFAGRNYKIAERNRNKLSGDRNGSALGLLWFFLPHPNITERITIRRHVFKTHNVSLVLLYMYIEICSLFGIIFRLQIDFKLNILCIVALVLLRCDAVKFFNPAPFGANLPLGSARYH